MDKAKREGKRQRVGQAVEKQPPGVAERQADRAAGRQPLDARTGKPIDPDQGRMERPDLGGPAESKDRRGLADTADREPHDRQS